MREFFHKDRKALKKLWKRATELNEPEAQFELGYLYEFGNKVVCDKTKSLFWCKQAAFQGYYKALCELGYKYFHGDTVHLNKNTAFKLFLVAAELGDDRAMFNLARMFDLGDGVTQNKKKAELYYRKAAALGNLAAQNDLAVLLLENDSDNEFGETISLLTDAANCGDGVAQQNLALL